MQANDGMQCTTDTMHTVTVVSFLTMLLVVSALLHLASSFLTKQIQCVSSQYTVCCVHIVPID